MRRTISFMKDWLFTGPDHTTKTVDLPHTWNNIDGQDGGDDYWRGTCNYEKHFVLADYDKDFDKDNEQVWIEFQGVNSSADVFLNGQALCHHDGGYSTFRAELTPYLQEENVLRVAVDNSKNDRVYPQKADFTFYGGIYREVQLLIVNEDHFALKVWGGSGLEITSKAFDDYAIVHVESHISGDGEVHIAIEDADGNVVARGEGPDSDVRIEQPHLWHGLEDPYLYTVVTSLLVDHRVVDELRTRIGIRSFHVDPARGFFLNGRSYPLRGVCRHQDRKGLGNAISRAEHDEDMALIREIGANTVRLAHYQHDQYFYDLCDKYGLIVWAEIPYISEHMPAARENAISQMTELIYQNLHHPSIICWGISNEITISTKDKKDMLETHLALNDLCHRLDPGRLTTLACYAACSPFNPVAHITDTVSWNLYLGWYVPGLQLNDKWLDFFHWKYPNRPIGYSEYGAEGMPNLHSHDARRGDHSEEYQAKYHEYLLRCFDKRPYLWATHVWNMFDFAADARDQGGEPGMNHKGLVTFDRKTKKDSFYLYKAWWSKDPFVHLAGKRYIDRTEAVTVIKVYTNQPKVTLYQNGKFFEEQTGDKVFTFLIPLEPEKECTFEAVAGSCRDEMTIRNTAAANPAYRLEKNKKQKSNWT